MCDDFDIKTLPSHFVSVSRPSEVIKKLNDKRRKAHEESINCLREQIRSINLKADEDIREESEKCIKKLRELKGDGDIFLSGINFKHQSIGDFNLEEDTINRAVKSLEELNKLQIKAVDDLNETLLGLEKNRSETFKAILKETKEKMLTIAHKLPLQIEEFFESELLNINQITLNNYQSFAELEKDLKLQVKNDMRLWSEELLEIKEKMKSLLTVLAKKSVVKMQSVMKQGMSTYISADLTKEIKKIKSITTSLQWHLSGANGIPVSFDEVEKWLHYVQKVLASLDQGAKNLVTYYKSMIIVLFNRFFDELEELKNTLIKTRILCPNDIEEFQSEMYTPTIEELNVQFESDFEKLQTVWSDAIKNMEETIGETYKFLKGAAFLWDKHFARVKELQTLVLDDLENMTAKNNKSAVMFEIEINIVLEKLRQGPNEKKLDNFFKEAVAILDNLEDTYRTHLVTEQQVLQKYKTMMEAEIEVLTSEIKRFLILLPPDTERDPKIQRRRASQMSDKASDPNEGLLPMQILYCVFQVDAIKNWQFGLWEAINQYLATVKSEILVIVDQWIEKQCEKIDERFQVKLAFHKPRYFRIRCSVYEKRLMELMRHSERFSSHKMAAEEETRKLREILGLNDQKCTDICKEFSLKTEQLLDKAKNSQKSHQIRGQFQIMPAILKNNEKMLKQLEDDYVEKCNNFLDQLRISNYKFIKAMKLFSENGNFHIEELAALQKNLAKLEEFATKNLEKCVNEEKAKHLKYLGVLHETKAAAVSTIENLIEEHEHNERVVRLMKKLQENIRGEVVSVKTAMKKIERDIKKIVQEAESNLEAEDYLSSFSTRYHQIVTDILDFVEILDLTIPTAAPSSVSTKVMSKRNSSFMKSKSDKHTNYVECLLSTEPKDEKTFIGKLNMLLYSSLHEIQVKAKEFYGKHHTILLDASKLHPTYDHCMEEALDKYKSFQKQCDVCVTENFAEFLRVSSDFLKFKNNYLNVFRNMFYRLSFARFANAKDSVVFQLTEEREKVKEEYHQLRTRLKPLYGHPSNQNLLERLLEEYDAAFDQNEMKFRDIANVHKETLEKTYEGELNRLKNVDASLTALSEDNRLDDLVEQMKTQLENNYELLKSTIFDEHSNNSENSEEKSVSRYIMDYFKNIPLPIVQVNAPMESSTFCSLSTDATYNNPEDFLNDLARTLQANTNYVEEFVDSHLLKFNKDCKEIWSNEINCIISLYHVKYDTKNSLA